MERDLFLQRLRDRLAVPPTANIAHPLPPPRSGEPPRPGYAPAPGGDLPARLRTVAAAKGWHVRECGDDVTALLTEVVAAHQVGRAVCSADPELAGVPEALEALGVEVVAFDGPASAAEADLGITGAAYAIAATGTVVLSSERSGGRAAALVPPVHLVLVGPASIVATPADVWRHLPERFPRGLPSQLVFASGPSRSADIEFTLTVGVHGPKSAWLALL